MDKIRIENLEILAKHGVFPEENFFRTKVYTLRRFALPTPEKPGSPMSFLIRYITVKSAI